MMHTNYEASPISDFINQCAFKCIIDIIISQLYILLQLNIYQVKVNRV